MKGNYRPPLRKPRLEPKILDLDIMDRIKNDFTYHPPFGNQISRYSHIRNTIKQAAEAVVLFCPESRERSLAITKLEEAVMWANASIARNEKQSEDGDGKTDAS